MSRTFRPEATSVIGGLGDPSPYLLRNERVVVAVRRHPLVLMAALLETIGFIAGAVMVYALLPYVAVVRTVGQLVALAAVLRLCYLVLEWRLERFVITDQRMMLVGGVLTRQVAVTPMRKVTDLTFEKPPVGQIFGYGTFIVESAGQDQALSRIEYLPRANRLYLMVSDLLFGDRGRGVRDELPGLPAARDRAPLDDHRRVADERLARERFSDERFSDERFSDERSSDERPAVDRLERQPAADLARTDPTLGQQLAGVDFDVPPVELDTPADRVWAEQFRGSGGEHPGPGGAQLFDAVQQAGAPRGLRERLGGLNGRGRRRPAEPSGGPPVESRTGR